MSNIVEANKEFSINSSIDKVWLFFSDIGKLLSCIPDCQNITVKNSDEAEISIKMKLGYISKTFSMLIQVSEKTQNQYLIFKASGDDAELTGKVTLYSKNNLTFIKYNSTITPKSALGKMAISFMGQNLINQQSERFVKCLENKLS